MKVQPFDKAALVKLNKIITACEETKDYLKKCRDCGLDVDKEYSENEDQLKTAIGIKSRFFPTKA